MSDDEADPELLALLRQHLQGNMNFNVVPETGVLESAEDIYDNAVDVALNMRPCKNAAESIYRQMEVKNYSVASWSKAELHPKAADEGTVNFIFTMDILNFSFWSDKPDDEMFAVEYKGKKWTGYWSLVASLQRALEEGIPITTSDFWQSEEECTLGVLKHVFRSCTAEEMPLLEERLACLREAGQVLYECYSCSPLKLIESANNSAAQLVNTLAADFDCFNDVHDFPGRRKPVRILKRAQILVADLWACFNGEGPGKFNDINKLTMFADYRIPQILNTMGCLYYSPPLASAIQSGTMIESGSVREVELRACSIWCLELIKREILKNHPDAKINAILMDFFLYDTMKEIEAKGEETVKHHRTRSIWY
ncbi:Queuosine salvage protein [Zalerion maritima]|uniref:Queuosine 5'-phosphate N-glycosylase/hydrolase n=1 Tax=Zalerion maritima TaxID=339359 RepID=A0AAD5RG98_9PEZI|nr:Queuosine salvage protein [Zalerion maritima]